MNRIITLILFLPLLVSFESITCDCPITKSLKELQKTEFENSDYIFIVEVLELNERNGIFSFQVLESLKRNDNENIYKGIYNKMCEPIVDSTGKWLIYGNLNSSGLIEINKCGLSRSIKNPEYNIMILFPPPPPSIQELDTKSRNEYLKKHETGRIAQAKSDLADEIEYLRSLKD